MNSAPKGSGQDEKQQQSAQAAQRSRQAYQHAYHRQHRHKLNAKRRERYKRNPAPFLSAHRKWVVKNRGTQTSLSKALVSAEA